MNRSTRLWLHTLAAALAALWLTLAMSGCGTPAHPMSDDEVAALLPAGRGAP